MNEWYPAIIGGAIAIIVVGLVVGFTFLFTYHPWTYRKDKYACIRKARCAWDQASGTSRRYRYLSYAAEDCLVIAIVSKLVGQTKNQFVRKWCKCHGFRKEA